MSQSPSALHAAHLTDLVKIKNVAEKSTPPNEGYT